MANLTAKDLRLGNLIEAELQYRDRVVNTDNKVTGYVTSINHFENGSYIGLEITGQTFKHHTSSIAHCSGVELTPSILEAAGFELQNNGYGMYVETFDNGNRFEISKDKDGFEIFLGGIDSVTSGHGHSTTIQYVHQLQNLYHSLTFEKLTLNLNQLQQA